MTDRIRRLPHQTDTLFLTYTGMETDLIFTQGLDLPGFASFPLLETPEGRARLRSYPEKLIAVANAAGHGVILETATWVASKDRAAELGYSPQQLWDVNIAAIKLLDDLRRTVGAEALISANIGPRCDAYAADTDLSADDAQAYHAAQMSALAQTPLDFVTAYTIGHPVEAVGITRAAAAQALPIVMAFTVETDGRLPNGMPLDQAIEYVDRETDGYISYYMVNCAHPDHFTDALEAEVCKARLKGIVANASRCSHEELDNADTLDDGDPHELGQQMAAIRARHPHIQVFGGCCGTDMRHLDQMAQHLR